MNSGRGQEILNHETRFTRQIITKLHEADAMHATGSTTAQVVQRLEIIDQAFHRWCNQYGRMKANNAKRLKELEQENARLKKLVGGRRKWIAM